MRYKYTKLADDTQIAHSNILELVSLNRGYICDRWRETFQGDLSFYC